MARVSYSDDRSIYCVCGREDRCATMSTQFHPRGFSSTAPNLEHPERAGSRNGVIAALVTSNRTSVSAPWSSSPSSVRIWRRTPAEALSQADSDPPTHGAGAIGSFVVGWVLA